MLLKSTLNNRKCACTTWIAGLVILLLGAAAVSSESPRIKVIYPEPEQLIAAVDSTFILGHLTGDYDFATDLLLFINGEEVALHKDGGFLAFLPVTPGDFVFHIEVYLQTDGSREGTLSDSPVAATSLPIKIPKPLKTIPEDTYIIAGDYRAPRGDMVLATGDRLEVMFRGTPGRGAWFSIDGVADSVPMAETAPCPQPYWGESVFGAGAIPDSVLIGGIYAGFLDITGSMSTEDSPIIYHLTPPDPARIVALLLDNPFDTSVVGLQKYLRSEDHLIHESSYSVSLNPPDYPFTVRFIDSVLIMRHEPFRGYFSIFQPKGVEALVVGARANWYRIKLSATQFAWVDQNSVQRLPQGILPKESYVRSIRSYGSDDCLVVEFYLAGKHPFRIIEDDRRTIRIQLFGVTTDTDWIRYDLSDPLIDIATWAQVEESLYELKIALTQDIWGYDAYYVGNTFHFQLNKPPSNIRKIKGKRIVIDPGHSKDHGAIGPTGLTEAKANLGIALVLADRLRKKGAEVTLTREDDSDVPLYDRPAIAKARDADLFISVHNNAVPDGVNPFTNNGVSSYYYHPHSIELARAIQKRMIKATGLPDHGLYHGNLAVNRPTQYPAVLIECAFMIIPEQEAMLKTNKFRKTIAKAIIQGIEDFLKGYNNVR